MIELVSVFLVGLWIGAPAGWFARATWGRIEPATPPRLTPSTAIAVDPEPGPAPLHDAGFVWDEERASPRPALTFPPRPRLPFA